MSRAELALAQFKGTPKLSCWPTTAISYLGESWQLSVPPAPKICFLSFPCWCIFRRWKKAAKRGHVAFIQEQMYSSHAIGVDLLHISDKRRSPCNDGALWSSPRFPPTLWRWLLCLFLLCLSSASSLSLPSFLGSGIEFLMLFQLLLHRSLACWRQHPNLWQVFFKEKRKTKKKEKKKDYLFLECSKVRDACERQLASLILDGDVDDGMHKESEDFLKDASASDFVKWGVSPVGFCIWIGPCPNWFPSPFPLFFLFLFCFLFLFRLFCFRLLSLLSFHLLLVSFLFFLLFFFFRYERTCWKGFNQNLFEE